MTEPLFVTVKPLTVVGIDSKLLLNLVVVVIPTFGATGDNLTFVGD